MNVYGTVSGKHGVRDAVVQRLVARMGGTVLQGQASNVPLDTNIYISWRFNLHPDFEEHIANGMTLVCIDLGYFDATKYERFSVSIGGVHGLGSPPDVSGLPERPHPSLTPWRPEGSVVQIHAAGWIHNPALRAAASNLPDGWHEEAQAKVAAKWPDKQIDMRWHPKTRPPGVPKPPPLKTTLDDVFVTVTYGSHASVQTIIEGVPAIVEARRCVAYPMAAQEYEIIRPDREAWIHDLSYREYAMMEDDELDAAIDYILRGHEELQC